MAKLSINDQKRMDMANLIKLALHNGLNVADLALMLKVNTGSIRRYHKGLSMGTNKQRQFLSNLARVNELGPEAKGRTYG